MATWAGAKEALQRRYCPVAVWMGDGASDGNPALVRRGATPITDLAQLFEIEDLGPPPPEPEQNSLF